MIDYCRTHLTYLISCICCWFRGFYWGWMPRPYCVHQSSLLLRFWIALRLPSRLPVPLRSWGDLGWHALWGYTSDTDFTLCSVENRLESRGCASLKSCAKVGRRHRWNQTSPWRELVYSSSFLPYDTLPTLVQRCNLRLIWIKSSMD